MASRNNFKTFLKQRKPEYVVLFPFLTDSQIIAKLRRIWNTARANSTGIGGPALRAASSEKMGRTIFERNLSSLASDTLPFDKENTVVGQIKYFNKEYNSPCTSLGSHELALSHDQALTASKKEFNPTVNFTSPIGQENVTGVHLTTTQSLLTSHTLEEPDSESPPQEVAAENCVSVTYTSQLTVCDQPSVCLSGDQTDPGFVTSSDGVTGSSNADACLEMNDKHHSNVCLSESPTYVPVITHIGTLAHQPGNMNPKAKDLSLPCVKNDIVSVYHDARLSCACETTSGQKKNVRNKPLRALQPDSYPLCYLQQPLSPNTSMCSLPAKFPVSQGVRVRRKKRKRNNSIFELSIPSKITRGQIPLKRAQGLLSESSSDEPPVKKNSRVQEDCQRSCLTSSYSGVDGRSVSPENVNNVHETLQSCDTSEIANHLNLLGTIHENEVISQSEIDSPPNINKTSLVRHDALCDLFLPLERQQYNSLQTVPSLFSKGTLEKRVFHNVAAESAGSDERDVSNYCMYTDEADIFM